MELAGVGIESPTWHEWRDFAAEMLNAPVDIDSSTSTAIVNLDDRICRIEITAGATDRLAYLNLEAGNLDEHAAVLARLEANGFKPSDIEPETMRRRGYVHASAVIDPAGFRWEISCASIARNATSSDNARRFVTDGLGLGHAVLVVPDLEAHEDFLVRVLGFQLSDYLVVNGEVVAGFYRCNARHHTIAVGQRPGFRGLHHLMVELHDINDVGRAWDRASANGIVAASFGRHVNDQMLSFYMRTPSGFQIEYGHGGRLLDRSWVARTYTLTALWGHHKTGDQPVIWEELDP